MIVCPISTKAPPQNVRNTFLEGKSCLQLDYNFSSGSTQKWSSMWTHTCGGGQRRDSVSGVPKFSITYRWRKVAFNRNCRSAGVWRLASCIINEPNRRRKKSMNIVHSVSNRCTHRHKNNHRCLSEIPTEYIIRGCKKDFWFFCQNFAWVSGFSNHKHTHTHQFLSIVLS